MILALAGGVGGAKLINGLASICSPDELIIGVNIGDDFVHMGLHISPDLDSVMYKLAGLNDLERGWGLANETWHFMETLKRLGGPSWFNLGDQDLATHIQRTSLLKAGNSLSMVTNQLSQALGIAHQISPISNFRISTFIKSALGEIPFQDYFVRLQCKPKVLGFRYEGAENAELLPYIEQGLLSTKLRAIIICPSNPFVSIQPMLAISKLERLLLNRLAPCVAVSPIIGGKALKGPAAKMMLELGSSPGPESIAAHYRGLIDGLVFDKADKHELEKVSSRGLMGLATNTFMNSDTDEKVLAENVLDFAESLAR